MECAQVREAISALVDDEEPVIDPLEISRHLADCASCRAWREGAHRVTRRVRIAPAQPAQAVPPTLLASIRAEMRESTSTRALAVSTRIGLVAVAIAQIVLVTLPALIFGSDRGTPMHVAHEMGSFDLAIAVGFLIVAWQPARARGMHLLVAAAALLLFVTAIIDLAAGRTSLSDEAPHLLVLAGWALMFRLAERTPSEADGGWAHWPWRPQRHRAVGADAPVWPVTFERDAGAYGPTVERRVAGG